MLRKRSSSRQRGGGDEITRDETLCGCECKNCETGRS